MSYPQVRPHQADVDTNQTKQTPADETDKTGTHENEPQPTLALNSLNQDSMKLEKSSERSLMDDATFNLIRQKTPTKQHPRKEAQQILQIVQQETKNNKMKYFISGEDPTEADSGSGTDDVTDVLRNLFL